MKKSVASISRLCCRGARAGLAIAMASVTVTAAQSQWIPISFDDMLIMIPNPQVHPVGRRLLGQGVVEGAGALNGDFTTAQPIKVPGFHGIEPALALSYASSSDNGLLGMGWSLTGFSQITRAGSDLGAPRFDATDKYMLDGMELVPCIAGSTSPSCKYGGTHSTKIESYLRISRNGTNNWTITAKDGSQSRYTVAFNPGGSEYKTALGSVVDTHANTVTYNYTADGSNWLYPSSISYNGMSITFFTETRTDVVTLSAGTLDLQMSKRLRSIDIKVGAARSRAYAATYVYGASGHSLLTEWKTYGTLATVDGAGAVSGNTLPKTTFSYSTGSGTARPELLEASTNGVGGSTSVSYQPSSNFTGGSLPVRMDVVTSISINDGRSGNATTSMSYSGGLWSSTEQAFLGFAYRKLTQPCITGESTCPYTENWFKQDYASAGGVERSEQRDGSARIYLANSFEYATNNSAPYTSLVNESWTEFHSGSSTSATCPSSNCKRRRETQTWDEFANPVVTTIIDDYDIVPNKTQYKTAQYVPNTAAYIVDRPAVLATQGPNPAITKAVPQAPAGARLFGIGPSGEGPLAKNMTIMPISNMVVLAAKQYAYDQAFTSGGDSALAPTKGDLTHVFELSTAGSIYNRHKYEYDSWGNVTATKNAADNEVSRSTFDSMYHVFELTDTRKPSSAVSLVSTYTWENKCTGRKTVTDANSVLVSSVTFDEFCRTTRDDTPLSGFIAYEYCQIASSTNQCGVLSGTNAQFNGLKTPAANASGDQWKRVYFDGLGRTYKFLAKGPSTSQSIQTLYGYNKRGLIETQSEPTYGSAPLNAVANYDAINRPTRITKFDGQYQQRTYGLLQSTGYDELNNARTSTFDTAARRTVDTFSIDGTSYQVPMTYDNFGRRKTLTDAEGNVWKWDYDSNGTNVRTIDPDRGTWNATYDGDGEMSSYTDAKGNTSAFSYDWLGRKISRLVNSAVVASLTYDEVRTGFYNRGRHTTMGDGSNSAVYDYDQAGRVVKMVKTLYSAPGSTIAFTFEFGYDAGGRVLWRKLPFNLNVGTAAAPITYDNAGRMYSIPGVINSVTYMPDGHYDIVTFANGVKTDYAQDTAHRLANLKTTKISTGASILDLTYGRDAEGKIHTITSPVAGEGWTYTYDSDDRLKTATNTSFAADTQTFTYSPSGNMLNNSRLGTYSYPTPGSTALRPHAVTATSGGAGGAAATYLYDSNGSMTKFGASTLNWNSLNQLSSMGPVGQAATTTYFYDGYGARVRKLTPSVYMFYPTPDFSYAGTEARATVTIGGMSVATLKSNNGTVGSTVWLHGDHLGSTMVVTDTSGNIVQRQRHRPFGERYAATTTTPERDIDFLGERLDVESGLVYQRARYLAPALGRYSAADGWNPARLDVGTSRYGYAGSDPINRRDDGNAIEFLGITICSDAGCGADFVSGIPLALTVGAVAITGGTAAPVFSISNGVTGAAWATNSGYLTWSAANYSRLQNLAGYFGHGLRLGRIGLQPGVRLGGTTAGQELAAVIAGRGTSLWLLGRGIGGAGSNGGGGSGPSNENSNNESGGGRGNGGGGSGPSNGNSNNEGGGGGGIGGGGNIEGGGGPSNQNSSNDSAGSNNACGNCITVTVTIPPQPGYPDGASASSTGPMGGGPGNGDGGGEGGGGGGGGGGACFAAGTPIRTEAGFTPIESIKVGDRVFATDEDTGVTGFKPVLKTLVRESAVWNRLVIAGEELVVTDSHRFRTTAVKESDGGKWIEAKDLKAGDTVFVLNAKDQVESAVIMSVAKDHDKRATYNFSVDDTKSFHVGKRGVWVHNITITTLLKAGAVLPSISATGSDDEVEVVVK